MMLGDDWQEIFTFLHCRICHLTVPKKLTIVLENLPFFLNDHKP